MSFRKMKTSSSCGMFHVKHSFPVSWETSYASRINPSDKQPRELAVQCMRMPYIKQEDRKKFNTSHLRPESAGELNFIISQLCAQYLKEKGLKYQYINEIVGVLECAKEKFYRRIAAPYEDTKIAEAGDIDYKKLGL